MARLPNPYYGPPTSAPAGYGAYGDAAVMARFFNAVYGWMAAGLALTGVLAWWVSTQPDVQATLYSGPVWIFLLIAELALVFTVSAAINRISAPVATGLFLLYSALNGLSLSAIFHVFAHATIFGAFVVSAATFAAMSLYGFITRRDLTALGGLLTMGLIGLVIASVVSLFWYSGPLATLINYVGVFLFIGLTAYDTQRLKEIAVQTSGSAALSARLAIVGALRLYLDFINLFLFILRLLGDRRQ